MKRFPIVRIAGLAMGVPPPLLRTALRGWIGFVEAATLDWVERRDVTRAQLRRLLVEVLLQSGTLAIDPSR